MTNKITKIYPSFSEYMQEALYDEQNGYYTKNINFGEDFITAPLLNECLAFSLFVNIKEVINVIQKTKSKTSTSIVFRIIECGGGNGTLASQLLTLLNQENFKNIELQEYHLIEISPKLQKLQKQTLENFQSNTLINWSKNWSEFKVKQQEKKQKQNQNHLTINFVIANELFDAFPCDIYQKINDEFFNLEILELLETSENKDIQRHFQIAKSNTNIKELATKTALTVEELNHLPNHYLIEVQPHYHDFIAEMTDSLKDLTTVNNTYNTLNIGFWVDYGYEHQEFYHHQRLHGTHQAFYKHQKTSVLEHKGLQDITAHVPFSYLATVFDELNYQILGYTSQSQFIQASFRQYQQELATLSKQNPHALLKLLGQEMGDVFKVLATFSSDEFPELSELFELSGFQGRSRLQFL